MMQGQEKMSKSDPNSAIFMEDSEMEVNAKIKKAYCPPQVRACGIGRGGGGRQVERQAEGLVGAAPGRPRRAPPFLPHAPSTNAHAGGGG